MAWRISGTYIANCSCNLICPCPVDGPPTSPDGQCRGVAVFHVAEGNLDDTDLSGVNVGLVNYWPSNLTAGNWKLGIVVDEGASGEQADALERIIKGDEGGPFEEFAALTDEWLGMEHAPVSFSDGDRPVGLDRRQQLDLRAPGGSRGQRRTEHRAQRRLRLRRGVPHRQSPGTRHALGIEFDAIYGETADYEFASELPTGAPGGRG